MISTRARRSPSWSAIPPAAATTSTRAWSRATSASTFPGNPNVIVQNMPGAASLTAVRYLDATAPKDGTVIDHLRSGADPGDHRLAGDRQGQVRRLPLGRHAAARHPHLLRVERDRHQDLGRHDEAQGVPDRHHRQGLERLCERRHPAQGVPRAGAPDRRLSRQQRAAARARARRARRQLRVLERDAAGLARQSQDQRAGALLSEAPARHAGERAVRERSRAPARRRRICSPSSMPPANWGGRSSSPRRCRRIGSRSCAPPCRRC